MAVTPPHPLVHRVRSRILDHPEGPPGSDAGFTLIELMVVLLILAILLAIAIPTFLGVTGSANDRAAESNLNTALTDAKGVYESNQQSYPVTSQLISKVQANEPSLNIVSDPGASTSITAGDLSMVVSAQGNGAVIFTLAKKTDECWWVADNTQTIANGGSATAPTAPWAAITLTSGKGSGDGVPNAAGEYYGVYKITPGSTYCDVAGLTTNSSTIQSSGFPSAATTASAAPAASSNCPPAGNPTSGVTWTYYAAGAAIPGGIYYYVAAPNSGPTWSIQGPTATPYPGSTAGGPTPAACFGT